MGIRGTIGCNTDGPNDTCSTCGEMGLCPTCGSASPWRCGCQTEDEEDDDDDIIGCTRCGEKQPCATVIPPTKDKDMEMLCLKCSGGKA